MFAIHWLAEQGTNCSSPLYITQPLPNHLLPILGHPLLLVRPGSRFFIDHLSVCTPGVVGAEPWTDGHRIWVRDIVAARDLGGLIPLSRSSTSSSNRGSHGVYQIGEV